MEYLYLLYGTANALSLNIITNLERTEQQYYNTASQILKVARQCHTHGYTSRCQQGSKASGIDAQCAYHTDDEQHHKQDVDQTLEEGLYGRVYVFTVKHLLQHTIS